jgi:hypothetical protein
MKLFDLCLCSCVSFSTKSIRKKAFEVMHEVIYEYDSVIEWEELLDEIDSKGSDIDIKMFLTHLEEQDLICFDDFLNVCIKSYEHHFKIALIDQNDDREPRYDLILVIDFDKYTKQMALLS